MRLTLPDVFVYVPLLCLTIRDEVYIFSDYGYMRSYTFTAVHILIPTIFQMRRLRAQSPIPCSTMAGKNVRKLQVEARHLLHTLTQQLYAKAGVANCGKCQKKAGKTPVGIFVIIRRLHVSLTRLRSIYCLF